MSLLNKPLQRLALGVFLFLILLVLSVWALSPFIVRQAAKSPLQSMGLMLHEDSHVSVNPFTMQVNIENLVLFAKEKDQVFSLNSARLDLRLLKIFSNHIYFSSIEIDGVASRVTLSGDEMIFGEAYRLPESSNAEKSESAAQESAEEPKPAPAITVEKVKLTNVDLQLVAQEQPVYIEIDTLSLTDVELNAQGMRLDVALDAVVNQGQVETSLNYSAFDGAMNIVGNVAVNGLPIESFAPSFPPEIKTLSSLASVESDLNLVLSDGNIQFDSKAISVSLDNTQFANSMLEATADKVAISLESLGLVLHGDSEKKPKIVVGNIKSTQPINLELLDTKVGSEQLYTIDEIAITSIDSTDSSVATHLELGVSNEHYLDIEILGDIQPFTERVNGTLTGKIKELSLPVVSPYLHDALGFGLKSGQVDVEFNLNAHEEILEGESSVHVRGLEMNTSQEQTQSTIKDGQAIPLNVALNMLKDDQGNIELDIPISGNVADPSFGLNSFFGLVIQKAVMLQAKNYLMNTFVPYASVVSVVLTGAEQLLKVRIEPLVFEKGQSELSEQQTTYLEELAALLVDRENIQIKTCAISVADDFNLADTQNINEEQQKQLRKLSESRQKNLKKYLVESAGIPSSRVLFCEPEFDDGQEALPRVELKTD